LKERKKMEPNTEIVTPTNTNIPYQPTTTNEATGVTGVHEIGGSITLYVDANVTLASVEKEYTLKVLEVNRGNKSETAKNLGISTKTLYNKLHKWGLMTTGTEVVSNTVVTEKES
jgi:DNA-binding NtrC family response regulator